MTSTVGTKIINCTDNHRCVQPVLQVSSSFHLWSEDTPQATFSLPSQLRRWENTGRCFGGNSAIGAGEVYVSNVHAHVRLHIMCLSSHLACGAEAGHNIYFTHRFSWSSPDFRPLEKEGKYTVGCTSPNLQSFSCPCSSTIHAGVSVLFLEPALNSRKAGSVQGHLLPCYPVASSWAVVEFLVLLTPVQGPGIDTVIKYLLRRGLPRRKVHLLLSTYPIDYGLNLHYSPQPETEDDWQLSSTQQRTFGINTAMSLLALQGIWTARPGFRWQTFTALLRTMSRNTRKGPQPCCLYRFSWGLHLRPAWRSFVIN